jgi:predicted RNase H-like HicB family nuclease
MSRKLNIIVFKEDDIFIASGVELDVFAQGASEEEAIRRLETVLRAEMQEAKAAGRDVFDIGPAPESVQGLFQGRSEAVLTTEFRMVA